MSIRVVQLLCGPARHAIFGLAFDSADLTDMEAIQGVHEIVTMLLKGEKLPDGLTIPIPLTKINDWCGICGSKRSKWQYEVAKSKDQNWDTAMQGLHELEARELVTRVMMELLGETFDSQRKHRDN